jgi:hypothetical protein
MIMFAYSHVSYSQYNGYDDQIVGATTVLANQTVSYAAASYIQNSKCKVVWSVSGGTIVGSNTTNTISVNWGTSPNGTLSIST